MQKPSLLRKIRKKIIIQRKYKDKLFRFIFREKKELLTLYNALNHTHYDNPQDIRITTMEDVIYLTLKNDISFGISTSMNLYEHQSTFNPNMPMRGVSYFGRLYEDYIEENGLDAYGSKMISLPTPQFIVFYNGEDDMPDEVELKLSDLFKQGDATGLEPALECKARMININPEHNVELMASCRRLSDYSKFVEQVQRRLKCGFTFDYAMNRAIDYCIKNDILADILIKYRSEVYRMFLTEYDEELHRKTLLREGREDGLAAGREEGLAVGREEGRKIGLEKGREEGLEMVREIVIKNMIDRGFKDEEICQIVECSLDRVREIRESHS